MKNLLTGFLLLMFSLSFHITLAQEKKDKDKDNDRNDGDRGYNTNNHGRENWFPNRGNVGIGTRNPSEDLEVIGDVRVTETLTSGKIETYELKTKSFNVERDATIGRNLVVNGNLGIGVLSPTERLHINGSIRASQSIFGDILTIRRFTAAEGFVSGALNVGQNFTVNGLTGLGIPSPTERLEVLGNIKATQGLSSDVLTSGEGSFSRNLQVSQSLFVTGNIGLGITSPTEKLDVLGSGRFSQGLFSNSLSTGDGLFTRELRGNQNIIADGSVGIGVASPTEKLDVAGNARFSQGVFSNSISTGEGLFTRELRGSQNIIADGSIGIGVASPTERLDVLGNIRASSDLLALNVRGDKGYFGSLNTDNLSITGRLGIGVVSPSESLDVAGNLKLTGEVNSLSVRASEGTFTNGLNAGATNVTGNLTVSGSVQSQNLAAAEIAANQNITVGNQLTVTGISELTGGANVGGSSTMNNLNVTGQLNAQAIGIQAINTTGDARIGKDLFVAGTSRLTGDLTLDGKLHSGEIALSNLTASGTAQVGSTLTVQGASELRGGVVVTGNSSVGGNLNVAGTLTANSFTINDLNTAGNTSVSQNLTVNGLGQFGGDVNVTGRIRGGIIEATEFRTTGGTSPFNFQNAIISNTLAVGTDRAVPSNYRMAVAGNIIATGVDIKIPEKWPDYVFTDGYKLLTIAEVEEFIKKHGHLPGVLSAAEMQKRQNYSVSEMDGKLLEKVEELTLYIIEQGKMIENLRREVESLKQGK